MPWVKLDDSFDAHRKVRKAGLEAVGLHTRALSHSGRVGENGHIDPEWVIERAGKRGLKLAAALVEAGLWDLNGDGWTIHDYLDYNPSKAEIDSERARKSAAGKRAADARWGNN
jgi:hypothetical protein